MVKYQQITTFTSSNSNYITKIMKSYQIYRKNVKDSNNLTLKDYYESIEATPSPRMDFLKDIAQACGVNAWTVKNWILGMVPKSNANKRRYAKIISELTGVKEDKIFVR